MGVFEVSQAIKENNPDIIHAHDMSASFFASLCNHRIPLISHMHTVIQFKGKQKLYTCLYYLASMKFKHIFWVSQQALDEYLFSKAIRRKSSVLYNIIDPYQLAKKIELDKVDHSFEIIYLGRLSYPKNPERLIHILEMIIKERPNTKIAVIGNGDFESYVNERIASDTFKNNIFYFGFLSNPYKILAHSSVMIMTSRFEGTPMVALEAIALGVPIVSTPVGGLPYVVREGVTGYLSNNDGVIVRRIIDILNNPELRDSMSRASLKLSEELNNKNKYKETIKDIYERIHVKEQ